MMVYSCTVLSVGHKREIICRNKSPPIIPLKARQGGLGQPGGNRPRVAVSPGFENLSPRRHRLNLVLYFIFALKGETVKKTILFFLILALGTAFAFAGPAKKSKDKGDMDVNAPQTDPLYIGLGTGVDLPGSSWDPNYLLGGGADVFAGYIMDKNLAFQLDGEEWLFTGTGYSLYNFRVLAEVKYTFNGRGFQPYILAGPGMVFQAISPLGDSTANFDALAGAGVQFDVAPRTHLFIEAKYNFILSQSTTFSDIPVSAGLWVGL